MFEVSLITVFEIRIEYISVEDNNSSFFDNVMILVYIFLVHI